MSTNPLRVFANGGGGTVDKWLNAFIDKLDGTQSASEAREILVKTLADIGFERFAYLGLHLPDTTLAEPVLIHAYPEEWHARYISQNYAAVDPVVQTGMRSLVPFAWGAEEHLKGMGRKSRKMVNKASEFSLTRGFTVPIRTNELSRANAISHVPDLPAPP